MRRVRFNLRTLGVIVSVAAIGCAVSATYLRRVQYQKKATNDITALGGKAFHTNVTEQREAAAPKWLLDRLGIDTFEGLGQIELERTDVEDIAFLSGLSGVQRLYLDKTRVKDLSPIDGMSSLLLLSVDGTAVTDLTPLNGLHNLEILSICDTKIEDLTPLHELKKLKKLYAQRIAANESEFDSLRSALPYIDITR